MIGRRGHKASNYHPPVCCAARATPEQVSRERDFGMRYTVQTLPCSRRWTLLLHPKVGRRWGSEKTSTKQLSIPGFHCLACPFSCCWISSSISIAPRRQDQDPVKTRALPLEKLRARMTPRPP